MGKLTNADLAYLSPYGTSNLKRFVNFPTDLIPDPVPEERGSAVMMDGTMTVSDYGGKPIVEET
jgi:hypothetical protein